MSHSLKVGERTDVHGKTRVGPSEKILKAQLKYNSPLIVSIDKKYMKPEVKQSNIKFHTSSSKYLFSINS